jgi:CDP-diacylglycerol--glycerol-3-phosphate 3-phosphatidyltransferase
VSDRPDALVTVPTVITVVRTAGSLSLGLAGLVQGSLTLIVWALAVYWVGDVLDGAVARLIDRETRTGAVADIVADRLCAGVCYLGLVVERPSMVVPVGIYLVNFMLVDAVLSLAFLAWPVLSPNYFYLVDRVVWRWNWSRPGKGLNSSLLAVLALVTDAVTLATVLATTLLVLKAISLVRVQRLPRGDGGTCAVAALP